MSAISDDLTNGRDEGIAEPGNGPPPTADSRLFHSITLRNILSFSPENGPLELKNLNVLIGPNGSGKSNLLEAIHLLRSTPDDLRPVLSRGGGVKEWIWKGQPDQAASIVAIVKNPAGTHPIGHTLAFRAENQTFQVDDESIALGRNEKDDGQAHFLYEFNAGRAFIIAAEREGSARRTVVLNPDRFNQSLSILAQRSDPENYPEISNLRDRYRRIRLYREWSFGRKSIFREPQKADLRTDRLEEDFSNLGLFLNKLRRNPNAKEAILSHLRDLYEGLTDFDVSVEGGTVQVFFTEGHFSIPAPRLSDGSLRYLCLLAILCDPDPPPLICIEEPELGLHPDLLPDLADLLVEASTRCQLIVTTHSDTIVDALTEHADSVVICEKHDGKSTMRRLNPEDLAPWLEKYRLGQLWARGGLGGTRW
jgi:predicted ATPase